MTALPAGTRQPWERQLLSPFCSIGEERGFCLDPAGNKSNDEESRLLVPTSDISLHKRIVQFGHRAWNHKKINSVVNCRNGQEH